MAVFTGIFLIDLIGLVIAVIAVGYAYFQWTYQYWKRRNVQYLVPSIPFGNGQNPFKRTMSPSQFSICLTQQLKSKGWKYCGIYTLTTPRLWVIDLELIKHILTKDFNYFTDRGTFTNDKDDPLGSHLFALSGKKWRNLRSKLSPTFTSGKMKSMFQTLVGCGEVLEKYIEEHIKPDEAVDIKNILEKFSTDIIGSCAFGIECNSFSDPFSPFTTYGKKVFQRTTADFVKFAFSSNFPNLARKLHMALTPTDVSNFFIKVVEDTVTYRLENNVVRNDFLQLLIDLNKNKDRLGNNSDDDETSLTMLEMAAQSFVFFIAGFETSATTMTFALFELAQHQDIQDKVREEINAVLEKHDHKITYDSLMDFKYMKQVIDETLRMYPPVPFLMRECVQDYKIDEDVIIEKGTSMMIPIQAIHMDEDLYENSKMFNPERFNEENKKSRHPYAHLPFGEGPRNCIGERFGIMQTKVGLMSILQKFRVTLDEKTELPLKFSRKSFITSAENGIWLNIERL